jgi:hypothetical protein
MLVTVIMGTCVLLYWSLSTECQAKVELPFARHENVWVLEVYLHQFLSLAPDGLPCRLPCEKELSVCTE